MTWLIYPENCPSEDGYYMTRYYNPKQGELLYKPLWFGVKEGLWAGPWPWSYERMPTTTSDGTEIHLIKHLGIDVRKYQPGSRADYYTQCSFIKD